MSDMGDDTTDVVDTAGAIEALQQGFADEPTNDDGFYADEVDPGQQDDPDQYDDTDEPHDDLGPDPDLSDLDPAQRAFLEKRINDLRGNYTKKTTEVAPLRQLLDAAGGNAQDIQDAYEFAQALQNDPAVRAQLFAALQAEANAQAQPVTPPADDPFSDYDDLPPEIRERLLKVDQLESRFAQLDAREAEYQAQAQHDAYVNEVAEELSASWQGITESNPDLLGRNATEAREIEEEIFALGAHTNGDLAAAVDIFRNIEARAQNRLIEGAGSVPRGAGTPPRGAGHSTEPPEPILTFKDAGAAALEYMNQFSTE